MGRLAALAVALALLLAVPPAGHADGPWRGQILDGETKAPLEGVVIVAAWYMRWASVGGWAGGGYHDSEEVVTGPDGRFEIPARALVAPATNAAIRGPEWFIFKAGYGRWRLAGSEAWPRHADEQVKEAWGRLSTSGVALELAPLKTADERRRFVPDPPGDIPPGRMRRYTEALNAEFGRLGLPLWTPPTGGR